MDPIEAAQRANVVRIAQTYLGTPYHHMGRIKGAGVDCLTLLAQVYEEAGLVGKIDIPYYPKEWHLHKESEHYLEGLMKYTAELSPTDNPQPGDIVLYRFGRCYSHGAIVIAWPIIIHAYVQRVCMFEDADKATWLTHIGEPGEGYGKRRPRRFFSIWR